MDFDFAPFRYHRELDEIEIAWLREEGRQLAIQDMIERATDPIRIFTDGLGVMGVGSWDDGPAAHRQDGYREAACGCWPRPD